MREREARVEVEKEAEQAAMESMAVQQQVNQAIQLRRAKRAEALKILEQKGDG